MRRWLLFPLLLSACASGARPAHDAIIEALSPDPRVADRLWREVRAERLLSGLPPEFASLSPDRRDAMLLAMLASDRPDHRLLARQLRTLYLTTIYSEVGWNIAGLNAPELHAPVDPPTLPPPWWTPDIEVDWLIVGSGPAGAVLGHELRRGGWRVLLVEQGPLIWPGAAETRLLPSLVDTRWTVDGSLLVRTGRAVGGGTTVNVDLAFAPTRPAVRRRLESWGWSAGDFTRASDWVRAQIGTRASRESEINANNRLLWEGSRSLGLEPRLYDLNTYAPGAWPTPVTDKRCAFRALLLPAMLDSENPLALLPDTRVERVLFDGSRATGVEATTGGRTRTLHARRVVLCAGAIGSPLILMRSGAANEHVGVGIIAHPSIPLIGEFDRTIDAHIGTQASVYVDRSERGYMFEAMSAGPGYAAAVWPGTAREVRDAVASFRRLGGFGVMLVDTPQPHNRLASDGSITYHLSEGDAARFRTGIAEAARILFKAGAKRVALPTVELPILTDPDPIERDLRFVPSATVLTSSHLQATCKMGIVVDRKHRVIGREGLYVVDASVFPESVGANPMQTIYAMAKVFADRCQEN